MFVAMFGVVILAVMSAFVCPYCLIRAFRSFRQKHRTGVVKHLALSILAAVVAGVTSLVIAVLYSEMLEGK
jgi:hypothetical protein